MSYKKDLEMLGVDGPIIACSSGIQVNCGVAIIRLSGFENLSPLNKLVEISFDKIRKRYAHYTKLYNSNGEWLDDIILIYFPAPFSFTGENLLEFHVHGNIFNVRAAINSIALSFLAREAAAGEFTYRAFKNNKMNLSQVEGLDMLINAKSFYEMKQGRSLMSGNLHALYNQLQLNYLQHRSSLEILIDFADDVGEDSATDSFNSTLNHLLQTCKKLNHSLDNGLNLLKPQIVIYGEPNVGKSSLFNVLLLQERAIVNEQAGTTRDYLSEEIIIEDVIYQLVDTAGIRDTSDNIEGAGIRMAQELIERAFFKILVTKPGPIDQSLLASHPDFIIVSHIDLFEFTKRQMPPSQSENYLARNLTIDGELSELKEAINKKYLRLTDNNPILLVRHQQLIRTLYSLILEYNESARNISDLGVFSGFCQQIGSCIDELVGITPVDEVLNNIFDNFCIGK